MPRSEVFDRLRAATFAEAGVHEAVEAALTELERDPLASAGFFPGDLIRCLMDLPARIWRGNPGLYARFRASVRGAALARRNAPPHIQRAFWSPLPVTAAGGEASVPEVSVHADRDLRHRLTELPGWPLPG